MDFCWRQYGVMFISMYTTYRLVIMTEGSNSSCHHCVGADCWTLNFHRYNSEETHDNLCWPGREASRCQLVFGSIPSHSPWRYAASRHASEEDGDGKDSGKSEVHGEYTTEALGWVCVRICVCVKGLSRKSITYTIHSNFQQLCLLMHFFASCFSPVLLLLNVVMTQQGLDEPFTGGLGSYKLLRSCCISCEYGMR